MSPRPTRERGRDDDDESDDIEVEGPELPDRTDGSIEFNLRTTFLVLFYDPAVRNYVIAAFSALLMMFLVLFQQGSDIGGVLIVLLGVAGILLRWVAAPPLILLILTYFMVFPFGVPDNSPYKFEIENGRFRIPDIFMAMSVMVYVACHYRLMGLVHQAIAYEGATKRRDEAPTRRPPALIAPSELGILLGVSAGLVVLGQLVWLFATSVEIVATEDFPIKWVGEGRSTRDGEPRGGFTTKATVFFVLLGMLFFGTLLARLVFGYWRLRLMGSAEGGMILLDGGWVETKRERSRLEKWRIWGRNRAEARAKAEAEAEELAEAQARAAKARTEHAREERARREQERDRPQRSRGRGKR
jgi:hypothetical protein